jgi:hypothetical protein
VKTQKCRRVATAGPATILATVAIRLFVAIKASVSDSVIAAGSGQTTESQVHSRIAGLSADRNDRIDHLDWLRLALLPLVVFSTHQLGLWRSLSTRVRNRSCRRQHDHLCGHSTSVWHF